MASWYYLKNRKQWLVILAGFISGLLFCMPVSAKIIEHYLLKMPASCMNRDALAVISAREVPYLLGQQLTQLSFFRVSESPYTSHSPAQSGQTEIAQQAVTIQIDQKDAQGRFIIPGPHAGDNATVPVLGPDDEIVFRQKDAGERLDYKSEAMSLLPLIEIEVQTEQGASSRWLYINLDPQSQPHAPDDKPAVTYLAEQDTVISRHYKAGFSSTSPFLIDSFHWRQNVQMGWSEDVTDMMKIRHYGQFFGFPFKRDQDDYHSRLVAVKTGPLRIIRRTENRVKVFWKLKTPSLYIDYIMMPGGFVMDTMIDIPFKVSFFFSDLVTLTTMDWNPSKSLPEKMIHSRQPLLNLKVNGQKEQQEQQFNQIGDTQFSLSSELGQFNVNLDIPDNFPIHSQLYLNDDINALDPPENHPGQFGNVGFKTTGWENIDSKLHHLKFTVCMQSKSVSEAQALEKTR